jgi:hypothetical protein
MNFVAYLDYNVIAGIAGIPQRSTSALEAATISRVRLNGARFALSAWSAYELAKTRDPLHVAQCAAFVESLQPLWTSDTGYLIREELLSFLAHNQAGASPRLFGPFMKRLRRCGVRLAFALRKATPLRSWAMRERSAR